MKDVEVVFHEAAIPSVVRSVENPHASMLANVMDNPSSSTRRATPKIRRLVFAASSSAYGDTPTLRRSRLMPTVPALALRGREAHRQSTSEGLLEALRHRDVEPPLLHVFGRGRSIALMSRPRLGRGECYFNMKILIQ